MNDSLMVLDDKRSLTDAMKEWTYKSYSYTHLKPFESYMSLTEHKNIEDALRGYFTELNKAWNNGRSSSAIRIDRTAVKQFVRTESKKANGGVFNPTLRLSLETMLKDIDSDIKCPSDGIQPVQPQKIISEEEYNLLKEDCPDPRVEALIRFLFNTGLRISEACKRKITGVYVTNENVQFSVKGKGMKSRKATCDRVVWDRVIEVYQGKTWLFENTRENKAYDPLYLSKLIMAYSKKKIGRSVSAHCFRHYFATDHIDNGMPIHTLSKLLGHSSVDITAQYYLHDVPPEGYWREK